MIRPRIIEPLIQSRPAGGTGTGRGGTGIGRGGTGVGLGGTGVGVGVGAQQSRVIGCSMGAELAITRRGVTVTTILC